MGKSKSPRKNYDWEAIEREYRAGQLSMREIGRQYGPVVSTIHAMAKRKGWQRDLTGKINRAIKTKLARQAIDDTNTNKANTNTNSASRAQDDDGIVDSGSDRGVRVITLQVAKINKSYELFNTLAEQLTEAAENREGIEEEIFKETKEDEKPNRRNMMLKAVSLPSHVSVLRDMSQILKNIVPIERQCYNLDETDNTDDPLGRFLEEVRKRNKPLIKDDNSDSE